MKAACIRLEHWVIEPLQTSLFRKPKGELFSIFLAFICKSLQLLRFQNRTSNCI
jgi:hypothetical protein